MWGRRRKLQQLLDLVALGRPDGYDTSTVVRGFHITLLDSMESTPASMVLDQMNVHTAADLLNVLQGVSSDAAIASLRYALGQPDATRQDVLGAVEAYLT